MNNLVLSTCNINDFITDVANEVVKKINVESFNASESTNDNPLSIKDVAQLTGLTVPTLYGYCQRNEIPYHKKGNRLYFFRSNILEWIKTGKQKSLAEMSVEADAYLSNKNKGLK